MTVMAAVIITDIVAMTAILFILIASDTIYAGNVKIIVIITAAVAAAAAVVVVAVMTESCRYSAIAVITMISIIMQVLMLVMERVSTGC